VGDEIWVLAGYPTPVILRPAGNGNHKFMGQAYVHGAMHGEYVTGDVIFQDIVLE
jgi:hypothetical protein